ncbi:MAG: class I SAM-dependent methyltransferase, partial [Lentisphaeria bacterium]|nr:class I SAM-dependent methyltransferase [Lentisphaeria bacterium]
MMKKIVLNRGREKSLLRRHPWIFSGAVERIEGAPAAGETVMVTAHDGSFLAWAGYSPASQITGKVWSFEENERIDQNFFNKRVAAAAALRSKLKLDAPEGGCRLIFSEADQLPGVIVDRFGSFLILQLLTAGAEYNREFIVNALWEICRPLGIHERSDVSIRRKEQLPGRTGVVKGAELPEELIVREEDMTFAVDGRKGQKTGFYFDLRSARKSLRPFCSDAEVLNCFSYTGAFAVAALKSGAAHVINMDSSAPALKQLERNMELNGFSPQKWENRCGDVFTLLRELDKQKRQFDTIILDPPKLIDSQRAVMSGSRAYQDLARL